MSLVEKFVPETDKELCKQALNKAKFMVSAGVRKRSDEFMVFLSGDNEYLVCLKSGSVKKRVREFKED